MSILVDSDTRVVIQGITGHEGLFHAEQMLYYRTNVVAGVRPGKGGEWVLNGKIPVFDSVKVAVEATGANTSLIFVPAYSAFDAILEAADANIPLIVAITEGVPVQDMIKANQYLAKRGVRLIGPNSPGILSPDVAKVGIIPGNISKSGSAGVVSRSGTLTYEVLHALKKAGIGVSTCVGIGGDPIIGTNFVEILELFEGDPATERIVLIGEIGGSDEELAADYILHNMTKPVVAFVAGVTAPTGKRMGHAGAIVEGTAGSAEEKMSALRDAGVRIATHPEEIAELLS